MKNIQKVLLLMSLITTIASCKKSSSTVEVNNISFATQQTLTGKWNIRSISSSLESSANIPPYKSAYAGKENDYYEFNTNGSLTIHQNGNVYEGNYELKKNKITIAIGKFYSVEMKISKIDAKELLLSRDERLPHDQRILENRSFIKQ